MSGHDWDAELKKVDRQLEKVSDEALSPATRARSPLEWTAAEARERSTSALGVFARLSLAVALGVAIVFWPYGARCGIGLGGYLGAVATLVGAGVWASVWTWRHRAAKAHALSLLLVCWGLVLAAIDVLPRVGYAQPTAAPPAYWTCPAR